MSSGAASAYWRVAGMSYLKYANLCADMVRAALKEPAKSNALKREVIFYRGTKWAEGKPGESGEYLVPNFLYFFILFCFLQFSLLLFSKTNFVVFVCCFKKTLCLQS